MRLLILVLAAACFSSCSSSSGGGSGSGGSGSCASLPTGLTIDPASACTSTSGTWSMYTINRDTSTAYQSCNHTTSSLYANQAAFDANEGTSVTPGVTITSNHDYVITSTCASGSTVYTNGSTTTRYLYIWKIQP